MLSDTYRELQELVFQVREQVESRWPTPGVEDSVLYAITEGAEALDAYLRTARPDDGRNREKDVDVVHELAQCLMMLITAAGPERVNDKVFDEAEQITPAEMSVREVVVDVMRVVAGWLLSARLTKKNIQLAAALVLVDAARAKLDIASELRLEMQWVKAKWTA